MSDLTPLSLAEAVAEIEHKLPRCEVRGEQVMSVNAVLVILTRVSERSGLTLTPEDERTMVGLLRFCEDTLDAVESEAEDEDDATDAFFWRQRVAVLKRLSAPAEPPTDTSGSIESTPIRKLSEYEGVQATAVFAELLKRDDPYALVRTIEHIIKMRARDVLDAAIASHHEGD